VGPDKVGEVLRGAASVLREEFEFGWQRQTLIKNCPSSVSIIKEAYGDEVNGEGVFDPSTRHRDFYAREVRRVCGREEEGNVCGVTQR
jgi:hypothetical protein